MPTPIYVAATRVIFAVTPGRAAPVLNAMAVLQFIHLLCTRALPAAISISAATPLPYTVYATVNRREEQWLRGRVRLRAANCVRTRVVACVDARQAPADNLAFRHRGARLRACLTFFVRPCSYRAYATSDTFLCAARL